MSDYIKREDAIEIIARHDDTDGTIKVFSGRFVNGLISAIPPADVRENVRGEWQITDAYPHNIYCSVCHKRFAQTHWAIWEDGSLPRNFCPNCGAEMRSISALSENVEIASNLKRGES